MPGGDDGKRGIRKVGVPLKVLKKKSRAVEEEKSILKGGKKQRKV